MSATMQAVAYQNPVIQFRARREGPEAAMQDVVVESIPNLLAPAENSWTGASLPLGAGIPDLVVVSYDPQVFALSHVDLADAQILAYLRAVRKARLETIAERMGTALEKVSRRLSSLVQATAVETSADTFSLAPPLRKVLPEIITIEVKVSNWQKAVAQAARNRIFAHRSFVALPAKVAARVHAERVIVELGLGLISVSDAGAASVVRKPRHRCPTVWTYYYQLASIVARSHSS
jgi:Flp pilus assembly secretin CpaC